MHSLQEGRIILDMTDMFLGYSEFISYISEK